MKPPSGPILAATAARASVKLFIAGCAGLFSYYMFTWVTSKFADTFATVYATWNIVYPYGAKYTALALDPYDTFVVTMMWLPLLAAGLATLLLKNLPSGQVPRAWGQLRSHVRRVMSWQAPPRRFWTWWCGGMDVQDGLVLAFVVALNIWYFVYYMQMYTNMTNALVAAGIALPYSRSVFLLEKAALTFGIMMWPNLWLLFLPIPQSSFLQQLTGLDYSRMIRYHRWLGHITMVVLSLHGWLYYVYWAISHQFWTQFSDWGIQESINNLAGTLAYLFALVLWTTSIGWIRRRFFEVFYRCHVVCFVGFMLFTYIHYFWSWSYFLPGLLLYAADLALRSGQLSNTTLVTAASVDEQAGVATVQLRTSKSLGCPVHELFMLVPAISRWQWHPISVAGTKPDPSGSGSVLTLHIKRYGRWTAELLRLLKRPKPLALRVSAPEAPTRHEWIGYQTLLLIGGGIGVTPLLRMLRDMVAERSAGKGKALPSNVHLVWTCRDPREFCILDTEVQAAAINGAGWLTIDLHCTNANALALEEKLEKHGSSEHSPRDLAAKLEEEASGSDCTQAAPGANIELKPARAVLSSPMFHSFATVIQPQAVGDLHMAVVLLLTFLGAWFGTVLGGAYVGESYSYYLSAGLPTPNPMYWKWGMVWFFTQTVMAVTFPYVMAVLPVQAYRYWRAVREHSSELLPLAPPSTACEGHGSSCQLVGGTLVAGGEAGLDINPGRPALRDAMVAASKAADGKIGVFVGGPEAMTHAVQLEAAALNAAGTAHFEVHITAHSL